MYVAWSMLPDVEDEYENFYDGVSASGDVTAFERDRGTTARVPGTWSGAA